MDSFRRTARQARHGRHPSGHGRSDESGRRPSNPDYGMPGKSEERKMIGREGAWVEPDENEEGEYILCIQTSAQVCIFDVGPKHFADELAKAVNDCVKLARSNFPEAKDHG